MTWLILSSLSDDLSGMYLYADDVKLFNNNSVDLQHAFNTFSDWLYNRQLNLAPFKCEHSCITRLSNYSSSFCVDSHNIATVSVAKDITLLETLENLLNIEEQSLI